MSEKNPEFKNLMTALEDHGPEGIEILASEPSPLIRATIYLLVALLIAGLVWSFFGRADVIVTTTGVLVPDAEVRRVNTPIDGELVDIYITEGMPVLKDDVLARINARGAIEAASNAMKADLELVEAERNYRLFPARKRLAELNLAALKNKLESEEKTHEKRMAEDMKKLAEEQRNKVEKERAKLQQARQAVEVKKKDAERYERLSRMPGGGGVSRQQVEEKRSAYLSASTEYQLAETALADLELQLSKEYSERNIDLTTSLQELMKLRVEYETEIENLKNEENKVEMELRRARLAAEAAARVSFENIDEENFLRILAPVSGVITEVAFNQVGDKVQSSKPLLGIAPKDAHAILQVEIDEKDRGFLREGLPVKMKFAAFPYQRYGSIEGTLEYISPATITLSENKQAVYKGRVSLEKDYFIVDDAKHALRYGMSATAEIVVRKRRLIDMALDPLRKATG